MTIGEKTQLEAKIAHPRLFGGRYVNINILNFEINVENDIDYIPVGRNPVPVQYYELPEVQASDMKEIEETFEPLARISTQSEDGTSAFADEIVKNNGDDVEISGSDSETIDISAAGFDTVVHAGATKIKEGSVTLVNNTTGVTLTEGTDYDIDYYNGQLVIYSSAGSETDDYQLSYRFKNTPRNIAFSLQKLAKLGGPAVLLYGVDPDYTGVDGGIQFTVFTNAVNVDLQAGRPHQAEVGFDLRVAQPAQV